MRGRYALRMNRDSAHEMLARRAAEAAAEAAEVKAGTDDHGLNKARRYDGGRDSGQGREPEPIRAPRSRQTGGFGVALASVVVKELKGTTGRRIVRGIFGTLFRSR